MNLVVIKKTYKITINSYPLVSKYNSQEHKNVPRNLTSLKFQENVYDYFYREILVSYSTKKFIPIPTK